MRFRLVLAWVLTATAMVVFVVMQATKGDWFPPAVSVSQYGVGPSGWTFSVFLLTMAAAAICWASIGRPTRWVDSLVTIGSAGCVVDAFVRTDPGGLQRSWHAKVHLIGSIPILVAIPMAFCLLVVRHGALVMRCLVIVLTVITGIGLVLLVLAAFGLDTTGAGPEQSWAWWQAVAVVADLSLLAATACVLTAGAVRGRLTLAPTVGRVRYTEGEIVSDPGL